MISFLFEEDLGKIFTFFSDILFAGYYNFVQKIENSSLLLYDFIYTLKPVREGHYVQV